MFQIGQKVFCVKSAYDNSTIAGQTYTITDINECCEVNLFLAGINHNKGRCSCGVYHKGSPNSGKRFALADDNWAEAVLHKIIEQINVEELVDA